MSIYKSPMQWINFHQSINQRLSGEQPDGEQIKVRNYDIEAHSLARGVAGSGKSLALINRVEKIISEKKYKSILVLCYNRFMQNWLNSKLKEKGLNVECKTFHKWSYKEIGYNYKYDDDPDLRKRVIDQAKNSRLKYQAILVDEAQDFYDEWFQALLEVLDTQTNSLFFVYDNTQSVYGQQHRRKSDWSWQKLGINVVGRSQVFALNYRNSPEILELAWKFIQPAIEKAGMKVGSEIGSIIEPKKKESRSSGISPTISQINYKEMPVEIAKQVKMALSTCPNSSIGILTHPGVQGNLRVKISNELHKLNVKHDAPKNPQERKRNVVDRPYVIVDSWNALKGVEFDAVIIAGVDLADDFEEKAGLYVAMTRSREHLIILYDYKNSVAKIIEECLKSPDQLSFEPES
ncbi:MAG: AAA family ATPase [Coleofasciculaceae cyanobacterium]